MSRLSAADDPVAIPPGVRAGLVELEAVRIGITGQVEPVLRPPLAVLGAGEQPIDEPFVGAGSLVVKKAFLELQRRRQAGQVEAQTAHERGSVRLRRVLQAVLLRA